MILRKIIFLLLLLVAFSSCKLKKNVSSTASTPGLELTEKQAIDFKYLFFNASKEKTLGNYQLAVGLYEQCIRINPKDPAPYYELASIYHSQGSARTALPYAEKAATLDPKNEWFNLLLAECYIKTKNYKSAIKTYEDLIKEFPERLDFYEDLAVAQLYAGKGEDAIKTYDKLEALLGSMNESISMQKLNLYKQLNKEELLLNELNRLINAYPKEAKYYGMLGEYHMGKNNYDKAYNAYQKLLEVDPNNGFIHLSMADYYRAIKKEDMAYEEMKLAFKSPEIDIDSKINILINYYYKYPSTKPERKEQGVELSSILTDVYPKEAKAYSVYGDFLYRDDRSKEARDVYRKAIALDKEKYLLWSQLLLIDSELNDFESMYKESEETIDLFPNQPFPYLMRGVAAIQKKEHEEAVKVLKRGSRLVADNQALLGQFYSSLGDAYHGMENHEESDKAYDKALQVDSNNTFVLNNYAYYLSVRKENLEQAKRMSKKSNDLSPGNSSFLDTYAWILFQLKEYEEAESWIKKAIESGGNKSAVILEHYGDILWHLNKKEEAIIQWKEALNNGKGSDALENKVNESAYFE